MNFNKEEIMSIVANILGSEATGLYINEAIVHRDLSYEDVPLLSTVGAMPFAVEDIEGYNISYGKTGWNYSCHFDYHRNLERIYAGKYPCFQ